MSSSSIEVLTTRAAFWVSGTRRNMRCTGGGIGKSTLGTTQIGVRWKTVSDSAAFAASGMSCTAVAPVPMTATFLPVRSKSSSQSAVCRIFPRKFLSPGKSGTCGWDRKPVAVTRYRAVRSAPSAVRTRQIRASSSHAAESTRAPNSMWRLRSYLSATWWA